jgi:hypothetical protein
MDVSFGTDEEGIVPAFQNKKRNYSRKQRKINDPGGIEGRSNSSINRNYQGIRDRFLPVGSNRNIVDDP